MILHPERDQIEQAYQQIVDSRLFKRSSLQERILYFLIEEAVDGRDVNEHTIGLELFGSKYKPDQNDSKVRVYVYYLRKKLEEYYQSNGQEEPIRFHIEKGQYNLTFLSNEEEEKPKEKTDFYQIQFRKQSILIGFVVLLLLLSSAFFIQSYLKKPLYCWNHFITDETTPLCILADHYTVQNVTEEGRSVFSVFPDIRSDNSFHAYKEKHPNLTLSRGDFTLLSKSGPYGLKRLSEWMNAKGKAFDMQLESETMVRDYSENNVIYIGQSKTMTASEALFLQNSKVFSLKRDGYCVFQEGQQKVYRAKHDRLKPIEYAMVSYQQLPNDRYALFFVSNHDIGALATLKAFTTEGKLKAFYTKLPSEKSTFNALFKVSGLERTDFACELVALEVLD